MTLVWKGDAVKAKVREGAELGLYKWAEEVLTQATKVVPLREGTLQASGHAWPPSQVGHVGGSGMQAAVTYDTPYAVKQHEDLTAQHPRNRTAKYLETPANASKDKGSRIVAAEIRKKLK